MNFSEFINDFEKNVHTVIFIRKNDFQKKALIQMVRVSMLQCTYVLVSFHISSLLDSNDCLAHLLNNS